MRDRFDETRRRIDAAESLAQLMGGLRREIDSLLNLEQVVPSMPEQFLRRDSIAPSRSLSAVPAITSPPVPALPPPPVEALAAAIGSGIRAAREARGWTQAYLAAATDIRRPNIARLERGATLPNLSTLHRVASGLEVSLESLLSGAP